MKKFLLLFLLTGFFSLQAVAQMHITTDYREYFTYDEPDDDWDLVSEKEDYTFFDFSADMSMFTHKTNDKTSAYQINSMENDVERNQIELNITSDVGNEYMMIIDFKNNNLRFVYTRDNVTYMVLHRIKKVWREEDNQ